METVAFFGAGMLGSGFVEALRRRNVNVHVWNRTFEKAQALERFGARAFRSPADAARGVDRVHICLRDDAAVDGVLDSALSGIAAGTPVIDHTTVLPRGVAQRERRLAQHGLPFLHAPVFMGPPNAAASTGLMLASGDRQRYERLRPALEPMTGKVWYVGEPVERAAVYKLMGNAMILAIVGGLNDTFTIAEQHGLSRTEAYELFSHFNPAAQIEGRGKRMAAQDYEPTWTLEMADKDARLMLQSVDGSRVPVIAAIETELDAAMQRGLSAKDLAAIAAR
ncbi:MAG TPA: NAD(P)-dependent oxidoreductase [Candidatus Baltobacteraceae bacterium]|jgi:3-hydroxyisobutyrate dehydrogenase|nr:NAD(P)-dependent oxidoreductase [Candidatus Baltobacteraceae bacterium]